MTPYTHCDHCGARFGDEAHRDDCPAREFDGSGPVATVRVITTDMVGELAWIEERQRRLEAEAAEGRCD